uniref:Cytochrome c oxidase subunit 3 n=1 Tax=Rhodosoma turcicum TaxID=1256665 RepID=S0DG96_9ASCI|nr:cytochrome c oxidase subunit III [Rhodosoma turcicum]CCO25792.1 cytochrome c oxidase subunit III [Rhodosoma turcicum]
MLRNTPFHLVDASPWPLAGGLSCFILVTGLLAMMHEHVFDYLFIGLVSLGLVMFLWWRDVARESTYLGFHHKEVQRGILLGMMWFITSEVFFFFGFFWTFYDYALSNEENPPVGIEAMDPLSVPLLNTVVLLSSGITVTWSHYNILTGLSGKMGLFFTMFLGFFFVCLQGFEYYECSFNISDSSYGSIFFMATGFHGFHVIVGSLFLLVSFCRMVLGHFNSSHHVGYECSIWYWHFVDVVWVYLYFGVYGWGSLY